MSNLIREVDENNNIKTKIACFKSVTHNTAVNLFTDKCFGSVSHHQTFYKL